VGYEWESGGISVRWWESVVIRGRRVIGGMFSGAWEEAGGPSIQAKSAPHHDPDHDPAQSMLRADNTLLFLME
jgi:hypothetical protein